MKNICNILCVFMTLLSMNACNDRFEELNTDPNSPATVPASTLMATAQSALIGDIYGFRDNEMKLPLSNWFSLVYIQYLAYSFSTEEDQYNVLPGDFYEIYVNGLRDLDEIIALNEDPETAPLASNSGSNNNQIAVARILKAWAFQLVTDIWGDIPYSEALQNPAIVSPAYDAQEFVYEELIREVSEAANQINIDEPGIQGDLIYSGNMAHWKRFANSLKMKLGMRMSEVNPAAAAVVVKEAFDAGVISGHDENALYVYQNGFPYGNPFGRQIINQSIAAAVTNTFVDRLQSLADPRLPVIVAPAEASGEIIGRPFGRSAAFQGAISFDEVSFLSEKVIAPTFPARLFTYAESLFFQAEAVERGWITGDAGALYRDAIRASMEWWGVDEAAVNAYLQQPEVGYDPSNFRKSIGDQKWIALFLRGTEAWAEWRRLGYPALENAPEAISGRSIPLRKGYPLSERFLNGDNYKVAITRQGPDDQGTRVWWDVN